MEDLKFGDVRKVKTNNKEFTGVYLGARNGGPLFVSSFGEYLKIDGVNTRIVSIAGVRLKPELRGAFNKVALDYRKYIKIEEELQSLLKMKPVAERKYWESIEEVVNVQGIYTESQFMLELTRRLEIDRNIALSMGYFVGTPLNVTRNNRIALSRHEYIRVNIREYPEYDPEYDDNPEGTGIYAMYVRKNRGYDYRFKNIKNTKDYSITEDNSAGPTDKHVLYMHQVIIEFKHKYLTSEIMDSLVKTLR